MVAMSRLKTDVNLKTWINIKYIKDILSKGMREKYRLDYSVMKREKRIFNALDCQTLWGIVIKDMKYTVSSFSSWVQIQCFSFALPFILQPLLFSYCKLHTMELTLPRLLLISILPQTTLSHHDIILSSVRRYSFPAFFYEHQCHYIPFQLQTIMSITWY